MITTSRRGFATARTLGKLVVLIAVALVCNPAISHAKTKPDFNGDGRADLVIGVPNDTVAGFSGAGAVNVIYGSPTGPNPVPTLVRPGNQYWTQTSTGADGSGLNEHFGKALAWGDFNGDGFTDLAIGVPGDGIFGTVGAGAVNVIYGSPSGLSVNAGPGNQYWYLGKGGADGTRQTNAQFGAALAAGDFNGDGIADLAVGVPNYTISSQSEAGAVWVAYGSKTLGLQLVGNKLWHQNTAIPDDAEAGDHFGAALAVGNFNGDHSSIGKDMDDLAIGTPDEDIEFSLYPYRLGKHNTGAVYVMYGSNAGLSTTAGPGSQGWGQDTDGILAEADPDDRFGAAVAVGDFNGDGFADLAVGVPGNIVAGYSGAGSINIIYGSLSGLTTWGNQNFTQDTLSATDSSRAGDHFGAALAAGNFNGDHSSLGKDIDDLAVGIPRNDTLGFPDAGAVNVLYGSNMGLTGVSQFLGQGLPAADTISVTGGLNATDWFGASLTAADFDNDGKADLVVGVPGDNIPLFSTPLLDAGAVNLLHGATHGLDTWNIQYWHQGSTFLGNVLGTLLSGENFGDGVYGN